MANNLRPRDSSGSALVPAIRIPDRPIVAVLCHTCHVLVLVELIHGIGTMCTCLKASDPSLYPPGTAVFPILDAFARHSLLFSDHRTAVRV